MTISLDSGHSIKFVDTSSVYWIQHRLNNCSVEVSAVAKLDPCSTLLTGMNLNVPASQITTKNSICSAFAFLQAQINDINGGVLTVKDDGNGVVVVDNTDPKNPVIGFNGVYVDGTTITGDGTVGNPLVSVGGGSGGTVKSVSAGNLANLFTTNVATPTTTPVISFSLTPQTPYTFPQMDSAGTALQWVNILGSNVISVTAASTTALPAFTYTNGAAGVGATITINAVGALPNQDGVSLALNDTLLYKDDSNPIYNGVYKYTTVGTGLLQAVLTRSTSADTPTELTDEVVIPTQGTTLKNVIFSQQTDSPTIGTDDIIYDQVVPAGGNKGWKLNLNTITTNHKLGTKNSFSVDLYTTNTFRGKLDTSGNLLWGTAIGDAASGRVHIKTANATATDFALYITNSTPTVIMQLGNTGGSNIGANTVATFHANISVVGTANAITTVPSGSAGSYTMGYQNLIGNTDGFPVTAGNDNTNNQSFWACLGGYNSWTSGSSAHHGIVGYHNTISGNSGYSYIHGYGNTSSAGFIHGINNTVSFSGSPLAINVAIGESITLGLSGIAPFAYSALYAIGNNIAVSDTFLTSGYMMVLGSGITMASNANNAGTINLGFNGTSGNRPSLQFKSLGSNILLLGTDVTATNFDTGAINAFVMKSGTAWGVTPIADTAIGYVSDITAGNAAWHFKTESNQIVKLYTESAVTTAQGIANALFAQGLLASSTISGAGSGTVTSFTFTDGNGFDGTVTNSTTIPTLSLTTTVPDARVMISSSGAVSSSANLTFATSTLTIGVATSAKGVLSLTGNTSGTVSIQPAAAAGTWSLTLPTTGGTNLYFLQTDGSGVTTWAQASGANISLTVGTTPILSGTDTRVLYDSAGVLGESANMTFDGTTFTANTIVSTTTILAGTNTNANTQVKATGNGSLTTSAYRTTNAGGNVTPPIHMGGSVVTAGTASLYFDTTNYLVFSAANGTRQIMRGGIQLANLTNTANSEAGDMIFLTQTGGAAATEKLGITAAGSLTLFNPAGTFRYTIVPAAIAAARTLNLPLITGTDTLAVAGLNNNFSVQQSCTSILASAVVTTTSQFLSGLNSVTAQTYRTTNGGSNVTPAAIFVQGIVGTAGNLDVAWDSTNQLTFIAGNGTRGVARAGIQITNLTNTAGSEVGDLIILTQSGGTAMSQKMRISGLGNIVCGAESALATTATDGDLYVPACAGVPTGVPSGYTGKIALRIDSTNGKAYIYVGGSWVALN